MGRRLVPRQALNHINKWRVASRAHRDSRRSVQEVFSEVYSTGKWGRGSDGSSSSGSGSRDPIMVTPYVEAVRRRIASLASVAEGLSVIDLGCGDFTVGSQVCEPGLHFVACDVVPSVIEANRERYADLEVGFEILNIIEDPLPVGDVALVRQVFQHLSNTQILAILPKLEAYRAVFITEHYPNEKDFSAPNQDQVHGSGTRVAKGSAVYLTEKPFSLPSESVELLVEVPAPPLADGQSPGWLRTFEYSPPRIGA